MDLSDQRISYEATALDPSSMSADPIESFTQWFGEAQEAVESNELAETKDDQEELKEPVQMDAKALTEKGLLLSGQGDFVEAHRFYQKALLMDNKNKRALWAKAETYEKQGLGLKAKEVYDEFLSHHPESEKAELAKERIDSLSKE